ncbi:hypothetical protein [Agreia sp. Leaf283]|uniref:hypothetical protein n=1 Tax=Agreia sp. Leaf283 TaxID=1736321 RepID=UPI0006F491BC|nr:hypothetical protein [Agreia sp. Leaf283]KQP54035.1 hypothetical protein ASF51_18130 [Agreia sp. Leaf283]
MSLMHTLTHYARARRHPLDRRFWPVAAKAVADDVLVVGESMVDMARSVGTPCTRVIEIDDRGEGDPRRFCAVIVAAVELVVPAADGVGADIWLDAELDGCEPVAGSVRLLGRHSSDAPRVFGVRPSPRAGELHAVLPIDIRPGDLLAFVVERPVALHDIRRRSRHWERLL